MEKNFPEIGDKETSFIDRQGLPSVRPDQTVNFVTQRFVREKYGAVNDCDTLMEIRLK